MPSSERILRSGGRSGAAGAGRARPADEPGVHTGSAVLRGRPLRSRAEPPPAASSGGGRSANPGSGAAPSAAASVPPSLGVELKQALRIAEERGYAAGRARALAELEAAIVAAGGLAAQLEADAPRETTAVAHAIAELALAIARRVVAAEVRADPAVIADALETAVASINGSPEARVLLHPDAVEPVRAAWEGAHGRAYLGKHWTFEPDPSLPPGGCVLRYDHGFVEAGLEAQLEEIGIALDAAIPGFWKTTGRDDPDEAQS